MRYSRYLLPTLKEVPSEAEVPSHQLMLRAGMIRKLASGIYSYLPFGLRSIRKVETIIREEMNRAGAMEVLLPFVQPAELWQESHRWEAYGSELARLKDRHNRDCCLGPTHEEVITDIARKEIRSYRQMPLNFYQIQTKFRDEIRPRFGVMRAREFIMKDAYSFDVDEKGVDESYHKMIGAYTRIFTRCGLKFRAVEAETGLIGGSFSHEFMVLAETGEETIVSCTRCAYAANIEKAEFRRQGKRGPPRDQGPQKPVQKVWTPEKRTVEEVTQFLNVSPRDLVKTLIFESDKGGVAVLVRGDHEISEKKLKAVWGSENIQLASEEKVTEITRAPKGFAGPLGLSIPILADLEIQEMVNFVTGANEKDAHLTHVNTDRDFQISQFVDIRKFAPGDRCPLCGEETRTDKGIEVGHTFKLGTKYSKVMGATFLDDQGREKEIVMGCYGIGVGRTVAAAIEQSYDQNGIIFPMPIAPFQVLILPININMDSLRETAEQFYQTFSENGIEVLFDDREETPGVKFKDADLLGIPLRVTLGERNLKKGLVEIKKRRTGEISLVKKEEVQSKIKEMIDHEMGNPNVATNLENRRNPFHSDKPA
ncbi:MAG: proline--tRNA ligase [Deltaproteobacteria bacterium RBG_16_48_10]|nr:MAG: proline--tRNA ligase [Deltaproteobacteria bacterium RBG_16_48_10]